MEVCTDERRAIRRIKDIPRNFPYKANSSRPVRCYIAGHIIIVATGTCVTRIGHGDEEDLVEDEGDRIGKKRQDSGKRKSSSG